MTAAIFISSAFRSTQRVGAVSQLSLLASSPGMADIARDSGEPCWELVWVVWLARAAPGGGQCLLCEILGHVNVAGQIRAPSYQPSPLDTQHRFQSGRMRAIVHRFTNLYAQSHGALPT